MKTKTISLLLLTSFLNVFSNADAGALKIQPTEDNKNQYATSEAFFNSGSNFASARFPNSSGKIFQESQKTPRDDFFRAIKRDDKNRIIEFRNSMGNGAFRPNEEAYPLYYFSKDGGLSPYIYFIDGFAICTKDRFTSPEQLDNISCSPWEVYCTEKSKLKSLDCDKVKALLKAHVGAAKKGVDAVRENEKAAAEKLEAEKRAKYTTQGRDVTKIRIESSTKTMQQGKDYAYNVIATLKDGSEISTANGGYIDEYEVTATGLPLTYTIYNSGTMNSINGRAITVPIESAIKGDKITLTVKSKFHKTMVSSITFNMVYSDAVTIDYNGSIDQYGNARSGAGLRVEIKAVAHGVTGEKLLEYRIFTKVNGDMLKHFKVSQTSSVNLLANGKNGSPAGQANPAKNGTNGGDITVVIDPTVKSYTLNISNSAGNGGNGNKNYPINGQSGNNGKVEKVNQSVPW